MQYRKMSEDELGLYYNRYKHKYYANVKGSEVCIRDCRSDRGVLGRSNLLFYLPMAGILLDKQGKDYDIITTMFPLWASAQLVWEGFSQNARILLGASVLGDRKKSFKSHFEVTFEAKTAQYIYVRDLNKVPDALLHQAVHYHLGNPTLSTIVDQYNHYVFPLGVLCRKSGTQYIIEHNQQNVKLTRSNYQHYLETYFGSLPLVAQQDAEKLTVKDFKTERYEDDMACQRSFVIDAYGRLLEPECSPDKASFIGATMVATETWKAVAGNVTVVTYRSDCFSLPAEYIFEQRPEKLTTAQNDRLMMLAKKLQERRREKAKVAHLLDFLNKSSDEKAWQ